MASGSTLRLLVAKADLIAEVSLSGQRSMLCRPCLALEGSALQVDISLRPSTRGWEQVQTEYLSPVIDKEEASGWLPMQHLLHANPSVLPNDILRLLPSPEDSKLLLPRAQELLSAAHKVMVDGQPAAHGDARPDNILVFRSRRIIELRLIDLDWAGIAGKAEYPILLNTKSIQWPRGVAAGQALQQNHDVELLNLQASPETAFGSAEWRRQNTNLPFTMMSSISEENMDTEET